MIDLTPLGIPITRALVAPAPADAANEDGAQPELAIRRLPARFQLHMPVDVRGVSLSVLTVIAVVYALHAASAVFVPLLLGIMVCYALSPVVDWMERRRLPRAIGAGLLIVSLGGLGGTTLWAVSDDASALIASLPATTQKLRQVVRQQRGAEESTMDKVQRAATQLEQAAEEGASSRQSPIRGVTRVSIERARFDIQDYLWSSTLGAAASVGQAVGVVFIAFFLLASGSSFRRKLVKIAGPTFAQKRITVQVLDEITEQIHRYLLVQIFVSVLVGFVIGGVYMAIGLEHAAAWAVAAFVLNFVPYLGTVVLVAGSGLVAFVQFGNFDQALLVAVAGLLIHAVSGNLLTPWLTSRTSRINAVTVFVGVLAFGALWGVWGLLLGVPILSSVKAVCDRVEELKPIGELMGA
ncbi:MAG: AI-2E family transporter [Methylibium sp.]|nr:AI-2E family transporter [Methylibium sp.]